MSETRKKVNVDLALREWPQGEKPATDWENLAQKIDARVAAGDPGATVASVSNENLFAEPLGQTPSDGHNTASSVKAESSALKGETMTMQDRERDRRSLQDLAKMAATGMTPPPPSVNAPFAAPNSSAPSGVQRAAEAKKDDSGIVDLAMAAQSDPQAAVRAQTTPLAKDGLFDDEPASIRPPPMSSQPLSSQPLSSQPLSSQPLSSQPLSMGAAAQLKQPAPSMPPFATPSAPPPSVAPASAGAAMAPLSSAAVAPSTPIAKKGNGAVIALVFGGLVAVSAIAAGGVFYMKSRAAAAQLAASEAAAKAAAATPVVIAEAKPVAPTNNAAPEPSLDPNALPTAAPESAAPAKPVVAAKGGPVAVAIAPAAKPAKEEGAAKLSQKDLPPSSALPEGDLSKAMGKAVGADGKPVDATPAAGNNGPQFAAGTVPQKPSQGAVTGAIGAVLPGARACLGPDDPVSRASITFTSAGTVQSVSVSGGAAGKPAEGCIKGALSKARVAPFAEATYTAPITIRH